MNAREAPLWRNWSGAGFQPGEGWTGAFAPSAVIGIPVNGNLLKDSGNCAAIERLTARHPRILFRIRGFFLIRGRRAALDRLGERNNRHAAHILDIEEAVALRVVGEPLPNFQ
jgi:hypothetical protein